MLYDIAECYREVGAVDQALFYYDRYLADWPEAFDRDRGGEEGGGARPAGRPRAARDVRPQAASADGRRRRQASRAQPPRPWQRWWFWTAIGVGVWRGIGAAALSSRSDNGLPASDLGNKRFF